MRSEPNLLSVRPAHITDLEEPTGPSGNGTSALGVARKIMRVGLVEEGRVAPGGETLAASG